MHDGRFDPSGFYEFNLTGGMVRARTGERVVILSEDVLSSLVAAAARDGDLTPLRRLGELLGEQVLGGLDRPASVLSPEAVLGHASAVTALFGWGRLAFERWGSALVVALRDKPELDEDELGAAALLGGRAGGIDIINQEHMPALYLARVFNRKRPPDILLALTYREAVLRQRESYSPQVID